MASNDPVPQDWLIETAIVDDLERAGKDTTLREVHDSFAEGLKAFAGLPSGERGIVSELKTVGITEKEKEVIKSKENEQEEEEGEEAEQGEEELIREQEREKDVAEEQGHVRGKRGKGKRELEQETEREVEKRKRGRPTARVTKTAQPPARKPRVTRGRKGQDQGSELEEDMEQVDDAPRFYPKRSTRTKKTGGWSDMPDAYEILDEDEAREWVEENLESLVLVDPPTQLLSLGPLKLAPCGRTVTIEPYELISLTCLDRYYSTLPDIGLSWKTLEIAFLVTKFCLDHKVMDQPEEILAKCRWVVEHKLQCWVTLFCLALFDYPSVSLPSLRDLAPFDNVKRDLAEIKEKYRLIYSVYNMLGHFVEGGKEAAEPVHKSLVYNLVVESYVNKIGTSKIPKTTVQVSISPRPESLPRANRVLELTEPIPAVREKPKELPTTSKIQAKPTLKLMYPPVGISVENKATAQIVREDVRSSEQDKEEDMSLVEEQTPLMDKLDDVKNEIIASIVTHMSGELVEGIKVEIRSLRQQLVRSEAEIQSLKNHIRMLSDKQDLSTTELRSVGQGVGQIDRSLATMISLGSKTDLMDRSAINQALLQDKGPESSQNAGKSGQEGDQTKISGSRITELVKSGVKASEKSWVLEQLTKDPFTSLDAEALVDPLKKVLIQGGREAVAVGVSTTSLMSQGSRSRIRTIVESTTAKKK